MGDIVVGPKLETDSLGIGKTMKGLPGIIEKLNEVCGPCFSVHKAKRSAKARSIETESVLSTLNQINGSNLQESLKERLSYALLVNSRHYGNILDVIELLEIDDDTPTVDLDSDWMAEFVEGAKNAFSAESKKMWADVLNHEARNPGSISRLALSRMSAMGRSDLEGFLLLISMCYLDRNSRIVDPLVFNLESPLLETTGLHAKQLLLLEEIGLISISDKRRFILKDHGAEIGGFVDKTGVTIRRNVQFRFTMGVCNFPYANELVTDWQSYAQTNKAVDFGIVVFTISGRELANTVAVKSNNNIIDYIEGSYAEITEQSEQESKKIRDKITRKKNRDKYGY